MINKDNWKEIITNHFNKLYDADIFEIKINENISSASLYFRRKNTSALGFCMFYYNFKESKRFENALHYVLNDNNDTKFVKIYDELHLENIIEYTFLKEKSKEKREIVLNYGNNNALRRDLKIDLILNEYDK
jgi:hypothetical protein